MKTEHQKRVRRLVEVAAHRDASPDSHAREFGADAIACPRAVELRTFIRMQIAMYLTAYTAHLASLPRGPIAQAVDTQALTGADHCRA